MKKFIYLSLAILALSSCAKENIPTKEEDFSKLNYTNTVTVNGKVYPIKEFDLSATDYVDIRGLALIEGTSTTEVDGDRTYTSMNFEAVTFDIELPVEVIRNVTIFKDNPEYFDCIEFIYGTGKLVKVEHASGGGMTYSDSPNYQSSAFPLNAKCYLDEVSRVKLNNYHSETYAFYLEYEDANGNKFVISYQGPNIEFEF